MLFNKNKYKKINDKKVLHKIGKHWAVVSIAMLGLLAGGAATTGTTTHADANTSVGQNAEVNTHKPASASNKVMLGASNAQSSANANSVSASSNVSNKASSASTVNRPQMKVGAIHALGQENTQENPTMEFSLSTLQNIGSAFDHSNSNAKNAYSNLMSEATLSNVENMMSNGSALSNAVNSVSGDVNALSAALTSNASLSNGFNSLSKEFSFVSSNGLVKNWLSRPGNSNVNVPALINKLNEYKPVGQAFGFGDIGSYVNQASNMSSLLSANPSASSAFSNAESYLDEYSNTASPSNLSDINSALTNASSTLTSASNSAASASENDALNSMFNEVSNAVTGEVTKANSLFNSFGSIVGSSVANSYESRAMHAIGSAASYVKSDLVNHSDAAGFVSSLKAQVKSLSAGQTTMNSLIDVFDNKNNSSTFNSFIGKEHSDSTLVSALDDVSQLQNTSNANDLNNILSEATNSLASDSNLANISAVSAAKNMFSDAATTAGNNVINYNNNHNTGTGTNTNPNDNGAQGGTGTGTNPSGNAPIITPSNPATNSSASDVIGFGSLNSGSAQPASNNNATQPVNHHHNKKSNHHYNVKNVPVSKSFKFDGMKATRLTTKNHYDYRYASKNIWLHTNLNMTRRNHRATLRKGSEFIIDKLFKLTTRHHHTYYRALINYGGRHDAFAYINGRNSKNMYYYATKHGEHYVYLRKGVEVHRNARFSRHSNVRYLRAHRTYRLHKIIKFGKFGLTRIQLSKNRFITANRKFVKLV